PEYYPRNELVRNGLLVGDKLNIYLEVKFFVDPLTMPIDVDNYPLLEPLLTHLNQHLCYQHKCDLSLLVETPQDNFKLYAHKTILQTREYFKNFCKYGDANTIKLKEDEKFEGKLYQELLRFI